jgi:hypothetical protein
MASEGSWKALLGRLWQHISPHRRLQFALLTALMVAASCAEIVSIGLVLPFVGILAVPERVFAHPRNRTYPLHVVRNSSALIDRAQLSCRLL